MIGRPASIALAGAVLLSACTAPPSADDPPAAVGTATGTPTAAAAPATPSEPTPSATVVPPPPEPAAFDLGDPSLPLVDRLPDLTDEEIRILGPEVGSDAEGFRAGMAPFEEATGARVNYRGTADDTVILAESIEEGDPPDLAVVAQPGRLLSLVEDREVLPLPAGIADLVRADYDPFWAELATQRGRTYAVPKRASVKSLVWYSPSRFADFGYEPPETWEQLTALTEDMRELGQTPWCIGISSGEATGWPFTDWLEDVVLRMWGPEVYDAWTSHEIPFHDPRIAEAVAFVSDIWFRPDNVLGGRQAIVRTTAREAGLPVLDGRCFLYRQASFYAGNYLEAGASVGRDGEVDAFYLPTMSDEFGTVVLGGGNFVAGFTDRTATYAALAWLASPDYANARISSGHGGFHSPNRRHDVSLYPTEIDRRVADILLAADPFRFDGSDLMPSVVGSGELWRAATAYVNGTIDIDDLLDRVEAAWPP